jgi:hypothetical protein
MRDDSNEQMLPPGWQSDLAAAGFVRRPRGGLFRRDGVTFRPDRDWPTLTTRVPRGAGDPLRDALAWPGLWKPVGNDKRTEWVFEVPRMALDGVADEALEEDETRLGQDDGGPGLRSTLEWAMASLDRRAPAGWRAPSREQVEALIPPDALTVVQGEHPRQGALTVEPERVAVTVPVLFEVPQDLPGPRRAWLQALLRAGQNTWRMARVGLAPGADGAGVRAEVDLTGAPRSAFAAALRYALQALRRLVQWLLTPAMYLVGSREECRALELVRPESGRSRNERG